MHPQSQPYLGIISSFDELRVLARSNEGLLRQSEELDELLSKVLKEELSEGIITKIQDNLVIGREYQCETIILM